MWFIQNNIQSDKKKYTNKNIALPSIVINEEQYSPKEVQLSLAAINLHEMLDHMAVSALIKA